MKNKAKHYWIFLSAFGAMFAVLSWAYEIYSGGFWVKGALALITGFVLYKFIVDRV